MGNDPGWGSEVLGLTRLTWKTRRSVMVSTVLLPGPAGTEPEWETMVWGETERLPHPMDTVNFGELAGRYVTEPGALTGHRAWCRMVAGWLAFAGRHTVTWHEEAT